MKTLLTSIFLTLLIVVSASANTLPTGEWHLESYNFKQKIAFPIDLDEITLNIHEDGKLGGRSGCNVYGGNYSTEDGKLGITGIISTMMACEEPSMQFEQTFFRTLETATKFDLSNGKLTITDPKTANFLSFVRVEPRHKCPSSKSKID